MTALLYIHFLHENQNNYFFIIDFKPLKYTANKMGDKIPPCVMPLHRQTKKIRWSYILYKFINTGELESKCTPSWWAIRFQVKCDSWYWLLQQWHCMDHWFNDCVIKFRFPTLYTSMVTEIQQLDLELDRGPNHAKVSTPLAPLK